MRATAIIAAAGEGTRIGGPVSKLYLPIAGRAVILRTLDRFAAARTVETIVLVVAERDLERCQAIISADAKSSALRWILQAGGATRQESVRRGLEKVPADCDVVVVHDAARPFVSCSLIDRCVSEAQEKGAVVVGLPARDTIKILSPARQIQSTPDRNSLWEIQTPQGFQRDVIVKAHESACADNIHATDDAALVERLGKPVYVLDGERTNIKITVPEDLLFAEALLRDGRVPE
ncbi:MAG: 2-C-methyl-D-erythritol 4-phosphate cytidylyltransferase [Candidatus Binatia bacterium]